MGRWRVPHPPKARNRNQQGPSVVNIAALIDGHGRLEGDWGPWMLDTTHRELVYRPDGWAASYPVDLMRCYDSAEILDLVMQVAGKRWAGPETVAGLVAAFRDILNPQASLCTWGRPSRLDSHQLAELIDAASNLCVDAPECPTCHGVTRASGVLCKRCRWVAAEASSEQCPAHRGQRRKFCRDCRANRLAVGGPNAPVCTGCECCVSGRCGPSVEDVDTCPGDCPCRVMAVTTPTTDPSGTCPGCPTT